MLYSSESALKATGASSGTGYISSIGALDRVNNGTAPATKNGAIKIPVDMNEGAGGKYVYLYYSKSTDPTQGLCYIGSQTGLSIYPSEDYMIRLGANMETGFWEDMNEGAGGSYIYIKGILSKPAYSQFAGWVGENSNPIKDIMIISSTTSESSFYSTFTTLYPGWKVVKKDFNANAGGKYIYLCYKK